jgi:hypothetical protein
VHILASWDLAAGTIKVYKDDSDSTNVFTNSNTNIDYDGGDVNMFNVNGAGANKLKGDVADFWFMYGTFMDLTNATNRRKFIDAGGKPVNLGADGSTPTSSAPQIFLSGATASWHTNDGAGGGFTLNGTLATAASSPSD